MDTLSSSNPMVGAIEKVGSDGFIVHALNPQDEGFFGGKRLFHDMPSLIRFLEKRLSTTFDARPVNRQLELISDSGISLSSSPAPIKAEIKQGNGSYLERNEVALQHTP